MKHPDYALRNNLKSFDWLRENGHDIRLHGNRFVQINLTDDERIHVWADILPVAQSYPTPIHDHTFDFRSTVMAGQLINSIYSLRLLRPDDFDAPIYVRTYRKFRAEARHGQDTELVPHDQHRYVLRHDWTSHYGPGESYVMEAGRFHATSYVGFAVTYMCRRNVPNYETPPRVLCPFPHYPDNHFDRYGYPTEQLWDLVRQVWKFQ